MSDLPRIQIPARAALTMLSAYVWRRLAEQARAVLFIVLYLVVFLVFVLGAAPANAWQIAGGIGLVVLGLTLFLEGILLGLMPIGERVGLKLPQRTGLAVVVAFGLLLGVGSTLAEPAVAALRIMGGFVRAWEAPLLFHLLENESGKLVVAIGVGVGAAVAVGMVRIFAGLSIKLFIYTLVPVLLGVSAYCTRDANLTALLGLAWDAGAVTTGTVTVPLVLSLGIGVSRAIGKQKDGGGGFGMIMLASAFPVLAVLTLGIWTDAHLPRAMDEAEFFSPERRMDAMSLFETEADLLRHVYRHGSDAGRRAFHGEAESYHQTLLSLADPEARVALLGDMPLSTWLRDRASDAERKPVLVSAARTGTATRSGQHSMIAVLAQESRSAARSVVPLTILLATVLFLMLRERLRHNDDIVLGIVLSLVGMTLLTGGIRTGLAPMGDEAGRALPRIFRSDAREEHRIVLAPFDAQRDVFAAYGPDEEPVLYFHVQERPGVVRKAVFDPARYDADARQYEHVVRRRPLFQSNLTFVGVGLALLFAFGLGYGSTLAEPALAALGRKVEEITVGTVRQTGVIRAVSVGVGLGLVAGMIRILYDLPVFWLLLPPYLLLLWLTRASEEDFAGMAWDSGGVTTGVVTVPLVMAMGLSVGGELNVVDGFGALALASVYPITTVLIYGLWLRRRQRRGIRVAEEGIDER